MQKKIITLLALAGFAATTSQAFAAAQLNAGNTSMAVELLNPAAATAVPAFQTAYQTNGPVAITSQLKVSTTGSFAARTPVAAAVGWNLCNNGVATATGVATTGGETSFTLTLTAPLASGTVYTIQDDNCNAANTAVTKLQVPAGTTSGSAVTLTVDNALSAGDPNVNATATAVTMDTQFSATLYPVTSTISFAANSQQFKVVAATATDPSNSGTTNSSAAFVVKSKETLNNKVAVGGGITNTTCVTPAFADATDSVVVTVAGASFAPVLKTVGGVTVTAIGGAVNANSAVTAATTSDTVTVAGNNYKICGAGASAANKVTAAGFGNVNVNVTGTTVLTPATFTTALQFTGGTTAIKNSAANLGFLIPATTSHTWVLDTTSFIAPFVKFSPDATQQSYFKLLYKGANAATAAIKINVVGTDGALHVLDFGTLTAGQTRQITGGDIVTAATAAGVTLGQVNGVYNFAATFQVNAVEADVYAYGVAAAGSFFTRVPMKVLNGTIVE